MSDGRQDDEHFSLAHRIDMICDAFEQAWRADESPRLEDFLGEADSEEQADLLRELLATELEFRQQREETVLVEPYIERFPQFNEIVRNVFSTCETILPKNRSITLIRELLGKGNVESQLPACRLFSAVPTDVLERQLDQHEFAAGEYLMRQGEAGTSLMIISKGVVEVNSVDPAGQIHVIGHASEGQMLGEMSLLTAEPRTANVVALERVRVLTLPADAFHELARQYPEVSVIITNLVADRLGNQLRDALTDKVLNRYRIKQRLGRGGMGVVYEAEDTASDQRVALKMLSHRLVYNAEALQRFRKEADIIESFQHPNIIQMLHRFAAFHTYFIAMEFFEGRTLKRVLASEGPLSDTMFHNVLGQLASALNYAHQADIVHRDIKPANIMLDAEGRVNLVDFGLAEPVGGAQTQVGRIFGTPRYMAPEQRIGRSVGKESDYFALGCVAYEMLTAAPLFQGSDNDELTRDFSAWQPPEFEDARPGLSAGICRLLERCLEKDYHRRQLDLAQLTACAD